VLPPGSGVAGQWDVYGAAGAGTALVARLTGQPADQTLMAALIRLQDVATSLYDNQPL